MTLTYQAAGIASRFMAVVVDLLIQVGTALTVLIVTQSVAGRGTHSSVSPASLLSTAGIVFVGLIVPFAYAIFFEMLWNGRTPGKRLFGLRTVRDGGYPINLFSSVIRNILRIIDFGILPLASPLVLCGLPGLACMFVSPTYKRIGDYAAGTLVIVEALNKDASAFKTVNAPNVNANDAAKPQRFGRWRLKRRATSIRAGTAAAFQPSAEAVLPFVRNISRVSRGEYDLVRRFLTRSAGFDLAVQAGLAERLARPLMEKMEMDFPVYYQLQYVDVLRAIERRCAEERGLL